MTQTQTKTKTKEFTLPNEKIKVEFVKVQKGNVVNPKHVLFGGMAENAIRHLAPRRSRTTFKYIPVLSKEEQKCLESELMLEEGDLSVYKPVNNYWDSVHVDLTKDGITLNLSDPIDFIKYKVVESYDDLVAASLADKAIKDKLTYQFVIVREGDKSNITVSNYNVKKEAYKLADKLEVNMENVKEFLYLAGKRTAGNVSITKLKSMLAEMVENTPERVVDIVSAVDYNIRALIAKGVLAGVIKDINGSYQLEDGINLCAEGETASLSNAIKFLSNNNNADVKNLIEAKLGK